MNDLLIKYFCQMKVENDKDSVKIINQNLVINFNVIFAVLNKKNRKFVLTTKIPFQFCYLGLELRDNELQFKYLQNGIVRNIT